MEHKVLAPMPGLVARVVVTAGEKVEQGQEIAVINCMKTEISVMAEQAGTVETILVKEWDEIQVGDAMVVLAD
jgi:acetyl-CoA carboxylase biotin carboxyl carrier protein